MNYYSLAAIAVLCVTTSGCADYLADTAFDAAPYIPLDDSKIVKQAANPSPQFSVAEILTFSNLPDAQDKLDILASGYLRTGRQADRGQENLDITMYLLGVATLANGLFQGSKDATVALGLSAATTGGARAYFSPQSRANTYFSAYYSLSCASGLANRMYNLRQSNGLENAANDLATGIKDAESASATHALTQDEEKNLDTLRIQALDALKAALGAQSTINQSPANLASFARSVIVGTTKNAQSGFPNLDAAQAAFKAAAPSQASLTQASEKVTKTPNSALLKTMLVSPEDGDADATPKPNVGAIEAELLRAIVAATGPTQDVNLIWGGLTSCALPTATLGG